MENNDKNAQTYSMIIIEGGGKPSIKKKGEDQICRKNLTKNF